ncbi:lysophospholipid acyltransferase family protein [Pinibacter soli]|uniref:Lysophospholipid acyltransferase family protein n=1 Tax=Pinibacter soli TaxID=3044211 RepID=A0ABT6RCV3_9BACT|nr:lysophospholipid acyltransferase family protein [Pinibacter soli]MDI3320365.1 lysophospholipid acyltransferase family protein [Pinibacter soli]
MKYIIKPFQLIYSLYAMALFVVLLLLLMPFFFIASFFGRIKGGNMMFRLCTLWADIWFTLIGIYPKTIHEAKSTEKRPCVFVANHISYLDIPMIVKIIREPVRPLGKYEMSKIPLFGFLYRNAAVMVDRSSAKNRARSVRTLKQFIRFGVSIFIFPEGTFNETAQPLKSFYDGAFRIAIETQTPIQPLIFPDTVKRLHHSSVFSFTPGICRAILLESVEVAGMTHHDVSKLKEIVHAKMEEAVRRYRS